MAVPKASASRKSTVASAGEKSLLEPKAPPVRKSKVSSAGEKLVGDAQMQMVLTLTKQ